MGRSARTGASRTVAPIPPHRARRSPVRAARRRPAPAPTRRRCPRSPRRSRGAARSLPLRTCSSSITTWAMPLASRSRRNDRFARCRWWWIHPAIRARSPTWATRSAVMMRAIGFTPPARPVPLVVRAGGCPAVPPHFTAPRERPHSSRAARVRHAVIAAPKIVPKAPSCCRRFRRGGEVSSGRNPVLETGCGPLDQRNAVSLRSTRTRSARGRRGRCGVGRGPRRRRGRRRRSGRAAGSRRS